LGMGVGGESVERHPRYQGICASHALVSANL